MGMQDILDGIPWYYAIHQVPPFKIDKASHVDVGAILPNLSLRPGLVRLS